VKIDHIFSLLSSSSEFNKLKKNFANLTEEKNKIIAQTDRPIKSYTHGRFEEQNGSSTKGKSMNFIV
jgi:hypothetical protein